MKNTVLNLISVLLILAFAITLFVAANRTLPNFDASYNLLSYQSLFNGTGFNYQYNGQIIPFNPPISTGPELYAPTFILWKLTGTSNYYLASDVLVIFILTFLLLVSFLIFKKPASRLTFLVSFLALYFFNQKIFTNGLNAHPLGETLSALLIYLGFYLLYQKKLVWGAILLGFALDTKTNIIVALLPTLAIFFFLQYFWPLIKSKTYQKLVPAFLKILLASLIIFIPYLTYTKIAPALLLNEHEKEIRSIVQENWVDHQLLKGMGHVGALIHDPSLAGLSQFFNTFGEKIIQFKLFYQDSWILVVSFAVSLALFLWLSRKHFTFYLFLFSGFFIFWWFWGTTDFWYRYLYLPEFIFMLATASLLPQFLKEIKCNPNRQQWPGLIAFPLTLLLFLSQFSPKAIQKSFNQTDKIDMEKLAELIEPINEEQIFTYGWFQAPHLMLLSNKRFNDYTDTQKLEAAKENFEHVFFISTNENKIIKSEMKKVIPKLTLLKRYGNNALYEVKKN